MPRTRRIGASILAVLTAILLLLSSLGWWANNYLLDSPQFTKSANEVLDQEHVQTALAAAITDQISHAAGTDLQFAEPFINSIVSGVVQSSQFQTVFDNAVLHAHKAIVGGGARAAVLDLTDVVDRVRASIEPIAPNIADQIPSGEKLRFQLLDKTQVNSFYDTLNTVKDLVVVLTILTVLCFAGALALSPRRWRTLALTGWLVFGFFVVRLLAVRVGRGIVGGLSSRQEYSDAAESAYKVILHGLMVQTIVIIVIALVVAVFAGWTDRHGGWATVTAAVRRGIAWIRAQLPERAPRRPRRSRTADGTVAAEAAAAVDGGDAAVVATGASTTTLAVVEGALAPRLPPPKTSPRSAHWWRAAGLLALGLFAVFSPGSLTTLIVVLIGIAAIYLAVTEAVAAWGTPREPEVTEDA